MAGKTSKIHTFFTTLAMLSVSSSFWMVKRQTTWAFDDPVAERPMQVELAFLQQALHYGASRTRFDPRKRTKKQRRRVGVVAEPPRTPSMAHPQEPDFGGVYVRRKRDSFEREIYRKDKRKSEKFREKLLTSIDDPDETLDDYFLEDMEDEPDPDMKCRNPSWLNNVFPTCNSIHEVVVDRPMDDDAKDSIKYLSHGIWRDSWRVQNKVTDSDYVYKRLLMDKMKRLDIDIMESHSLDAQIMDIFSSSPFVMDIYSYCGTSVFIETMETDLHSKVEIVSNTDRWTEGELIQIAIAMATGLAELHGFEGGVIFSNDLKLEHWLISSSGEIKLSDFNSAEYLSWNATASSYCTIDEDPKEAFSFRFPPELFKEETKVSETVDVWAFGWSLYVLLNRGEQSARGISESRLKEMKESARKGDLSFFKEFRWSDSLIEGQLIQIIKHCWNYEKENRPFMGDIVRRLYKVRDEARRRGEVTTSTWVRNPYG